MAVEAATVVMMAFRDMETGPQPARMQNQCETQRQMNGGLILEKPRFSCDVPDRYVKPKCDMIMPYYDDNT